MKYVYVYLDPRCAGRFEYGSICFLFKPFYVGKGSGDRWQIHLRESNLKRNQNPKKDRLIIKLKTEFNLREYVVKFTCASDEEALALETKLIELIGLENLTNLTEGGIGLCGFKHSTEFCEMIKAVNKKPKPEGFGAKVSRTKKGVPLTDAHKKALSGRKFTEEHKLKLRLAKLGKPRWQKSNPLV